MMKYLIILEPTETGFAVQVPDLAIITHGDTIDEAKQAAFIAIQINLQAYLDAGMEIPGIQPVERHLSNPDLEDLLFAYVEVPEPLHKIAA